MPSMASLQTKSEQIDSRIPSLSIACRDRSWRYLLLPGRSFDFWTAPSLRRLGVGPALGIGGRRLTGAVGTK